LVSIEIKIDEIDKQYLITMITNIKHNIKDFLLGGQSDYEIIKRFVREFIKKTATKKYTKKIHTI